jgi:hypothetical protein
MSEGLLTAVFATSTVAAGVNFPARTMVFFNSDRFNGTEFIPLDATQLHQMTGRAGRRGMDKIGFALAVPAATWTCAWWPAWSSRPGKVVSRIRINFSMVLNLLLSHTPDQIEELLKRSFATWLLIPKPRTAAGKAAWPMFTKSCGKISAPPGFSQGDGIRERGRPAHRRRHLGLPAAGGPAPARGRMPAPGPAAGRGCGPNGRRVRLYGQRKRNR